MVECRPHKAVVVGSIPTLGTFDEVGLYAGVA